MFSTVKTSEYFDVQFGDEVLQLHKFSLFTKQTKKLHIYTFTSKLYN